MGQIQISEELFSRLYGYFLLGRRDALQEEMIRNGLEEKMCRIQARADYISKKKDTGT